MSRLWAVVIFIGRSSRRIAVTVIGVALVLAGFAGIVLPLLPGPLLIIGGLAVLATEYVWARRALTAAKRKADQARTKVRKRREGKRALGPGSDGSPPGGDAA
ncbi:MAG: PGPGW domain-containing protein [Acidimicrobiia bacterium]